MRQRTKSITLLFLALFLANARNALASSTWYVDAIHGSDSNNGATPASACKTIARAISYSTLGDSIAVAAGTYKENLSIGFDLTIVGSNAWTTSIDGSHSDTVVGINSSSARVNISQLTITNGTGLTHGGGGICNVGTLTLNNVTVSGNSSNDSVTAVAGLGGGIYNAGTLTMFNSTVSGNSVIRYRPRGYSVGGWSLQYREASYCQ